MISEIQSHVKRDVIVRQTDVEFIDEPDDDENDDDNRKEKITVYEPVLEDIQTSSGEKVTNEKGLIREFRSKDSRTNRISQMAVVDDVIAGLEELLIDESYGLKNIEFLDKSGELTTNRSRISLQLPDIASGRWNRKDDKIRTIVLIQLKFIFYTNFYYIVEIDRFSENEHFKGLTIESSTKLSQTQIKSLMEEIVKKEGKNITDKEKVITIKTFKHNKGGMSWAAKVEGLIADKFEIHRINFRQTAKS